MVRYPILCFCERKIILEWNPLKQNAALLYLMIIVMSDLDRVVAIAEFCVVVNLKVTQKHNNISILECLGKVKGGQTKYITFIKPVYRSSYLMIAEWHTLITKLLNQMGTEIMQTLNIRCQLSSKLCKFINFLLDTEENLYVRAICSITG